MLSPQATPIFRSQEPPEAVPSRRTRAFPLPSTPRPATGNSAREAAQHPRPLHEPHRPSHHHNETRTHGHHEAVCNHDEGPCSYCHAVSDDLSEGNFASDEKLTKDEARKLMRLIHQATLVPAKP